MNMGAVALGVYAVSVAVWWGAYAIDVRFQEREAAKHWVWAGALYLMPRSQVNVAFRDVEKRRWEERVDLAQQARVLRRWALVWPVLAFGMIVDAGRRKLVSHVIGS